MSLDLEAVIEYNAMSAHTIWQMLSETHSRRLSGDELEFPHIATAIKERDKPYFDIKFEGGSLVYSAVGNSDLSFIQINRISDEEDAGEWLAPLFGSTSFINARLYESEYEFWQNASDPLQYQVRNRSLDGVKTFIDVDLKYKFIDISKNPGRRVLRDGYIESIGHIMWFSKRFWEITGASLDKVKKELNCEVTAIPSGIVRVRFGNSPFESAEGADGLLQQKLRKTLFPMSDE